MPTAFITTWDSFRNETKQHYLSIDFKEFTPPSGQPIILHSYTGGVIAKSVAKEEGFDPTDWYIINTIKPDDECLFLILEQKNQTNNFKSISLRWHF